MTDTDSDIAEVYPAGTGADPSEAAATAADDLMQDAPASDGAAEADDAAESRAVAQADATPQFGEEDAEIEGSETGDTETAPPVARGSRRALLEREGEVAADFLETLLDICDLDGDLDVDVDGDRAVVSIVDSDEGRVPRRLVGQEGATLDALQELTRLAVQSETGERSRLMLDIAGHRADRRRALVAQAHDAIKAVKSTGERHPMTPMTAYERKIVHDEVLAAGLVSESEGTEPRRYVVILPA